MSELRDLMFSAEPVGSGVEVAVDRFFRYEGGEEAGLHGFVGTPACTRVGAVGAAGRGPEEWHVRCAELAAHLLATKPSLIKHGAKILVRDIWP